MVYIFQRGSTSPDPDPSSVVVVVVDVVVVVAALQASVFCVIDVTGAKMKKYWF
jgi:hypothetical protein